MAGVAGDIRYLVITPTGGARGGALGSQGEAAGGYARLARLPVPPALL